MNLRAVVAKQRKRILQLTKNVRPAASPLITQVSDVSRLAQLLSRDEASSKSTFLQTCRSPAHKHMRESSSITTMPKQNKLGTTQH